MNEPRRDGTYRVAAGRYLPCMMIALTTSAVAGEPAVLYINPCADDCTFTQGVDDSVANSTSVFDQTRTLSAFAHGEATFGAVEQCIRNVLAPFNIAVTLTDPSPTPHIELVIAGTSAQAGFPSGSSGVAPFNCGFIPGAPIFAFANSIGDDVETLCQTAMFQLGAIAGLEPLYHCPDVMSYLVGCGTKSFTNHASQCGAFTPATCICGGTTRNAFEVMQSRFPGALIFQDGFEQQAAAIASAHLSAR